MNKSVETDFGMKEAFAKNFKKLLDQSGMKQVDIARALKVSSATVNDWAKGRAYPRMDKVQLLADFFGVQKSDLVEEFDIIPDEDKEVLELFHKVPKERRAFVLSLIQSTIDNL